MSSLQKRLIFSAIFISITVYSIFYAPLWFFFAIVQVFNLVGLYEFLELAARKGFKVNRILGLLGGFMLPFAAAYYSSETFVLVTICLALFVANFHPKLRENALVSTAITFFGIVYVSLFFSHLIKIKNLEHGAAWVFYTLLLVKGGDAGAFFVGKKYGKIKLIEHISPNKSVEGAIGGFCTTIALSVLSKAYLPHVPFMHLLGLGAVIGVVSQLGDLAESLIKRDVGVKDSGVIPGLGGILDVLDSVLLSLPFVYYYIHFLIQTGIQL